MNEFYLPCKIMEVYLYFLLVSFSFIQASWCYFVSNTSATWTEQNVECKMATPVIQYERLELNVTLDQPMPNLGVWVGYYEKMTTFDYIGCIKTGNVQLIPTAIELGVPTPGRCYSACAYTQYIGIKKSECYCLETKPDGKITEQDCNIRCNDFSQTVCGGNDHISLYRISTSDTNFIQNRGEDKCLQIYFRDEEIYKWNDCLRKMWASCSSESVHIWRRPKNWYDAAKLCFKAGTYPTLLEDIRHMTNITFYLWTGVVRSDVIYKITELGTISSDIMYGYLTYEESLGYVLKFSQADVRRQILCENAMDTVIPKTTMRISSTTQAHRSTTNRNDNRYNSTNTQEMDTVIPKTTMSISSTTQAHRSTTNRNDNSYNSTNPQATGTAASNPTITMLYTTQAHGSTISINNSSYKERITQDISVTVSVTIAVSCAVVVVISVFVVIVVLIKLRKKNQGARQTKVEYIPEQTNYITPISDEVGDGASATVQDNDTNGGNCGYENQNPQRNVYESLRESRVEEHGYGTSRKATGGFYQPLKTDRIDEHNYKKAEQLRELPYDSLEDTTKDTCNYETSEQTTNVAAYEWVE